MKIFIAGATGVLGRRVVARLVRRGHAVTGFARTDAAAEGLRRAGAVPANVDLFDRGGVAASRRTEVRGCDAVLHLATAIPRRLDGKRRDWADNDRIRREGTSVLLDAALAGGASFYLQQSVTFLYGDRGGAWVDERAPTDLEPAAVLRSAADMEAAVLEARGRGLPAVILRFGSFYASDAAHTRDLLARVARRRFPVIGPGRIYWNSIHADDAAEATARAVDRRESIAGETINVTDGRPAAQSEVARFLAEATGAPAPRRVPLWLVRLALPSHVREIVLASHRCRNDRARERLGWSPAFTSYREGYAAVAASIGGAR